METRLKPIQRLTFSFGDFTTQESRPDYLELKQAVQKNNEFDIRVDKETSKEEKYSDNDKNASKQDVWSEQYNQNCITKIFLSSRQRQANCIGKMTLAALSEQKHLMVLYERARQFIHVYKWNERITDSLRQLKKQNCPFITKIQTIVVFNNEREIICKEQYSKVMMTLEGGYIVGIKPHEQKEKEQLEQTPTVQTQVQSSDNDNVTTEGNAQIPSGITNLE
ncbi:hypothetical protein RFI_36863, partial [Reticulomyxa filosa]